MECSLSIFERFTRGRTPPNPLPGLRVTLRVDRPTVSAPLGRRTSNNLRVYSPQSPVKVPAGGYCMTRTLRHLHRRSSLRLMCICISAKHQVCGKKRDMESRRKIFGPIEKVLQLLQENVLATRSSQSRARDDQKSNQHPRASTKGTSQPCEVQVRPGEVVGEMAIFHQQTSVQF